MQSELEHAKSVVVANQTIRGDGGRKVVMTVSAGAGDDLDDASGRVEVSVCVLRREAFVVMRVAIHNEVRVGVIKVLPERLHAEIGNNACGRSD